MKIAYGTIQGSVHRNLDYNNQDSVLVIQNNNLVVGIVADGCGSGSNSEVGAQLGAKKLSKIIIEKIASNIDWKIHLKEEMQIYSKLIAELHDNSIPQFVNDYLLYTLIGFVKNGDIITLFSYGDGIIVIDDDVQIIDQKNRPKYLNNELKNSDGGDFQFQEFKYEGQKILIGSDGVEDIIDGISKRMIWEYSSFSEFINDENNYINPVQISKFLHNYSKKEILKDDCTLIMIKE